MISLWRFIHEQRIFYFSQYSKKFGDYPNGICTALSLKVSPNVGPDLTVGMTEEDLKQSPSII